MPEKPTLSDQSIIGYLKTYYDLKILALAPLPLGADADARVYKADVADKSYFIKLKRGIHNDASIAVMNLLATIGLKQIILPLKTINGQSIKQVEGYTLIVYPFVAGENGFNQTLTEEQWYILGTALRKLHEVDVPSSLQGQLRQETYSPKWRDSVLSIYAYIKTEPILDGIALKLYNFMKENAKTIERLIDCADQLAQKLKNNSPKFVLCHSDIHAGNVLIDSNNAIYIVDWDDPIMAPKERDLMFIGGGVGNVWNMPHEEAMLYRGYGKTEINKTVLAYYRHERIVEDIAIYGENIFFTESSNEAKLEDYNHFKSMFEPRGVIEIAFET
jgi:spectinomycin phosphotransferase